jgi:NADPH:quinone reductase-like Zn-dependent oxidoreductase
MKAAVVERPGDPGSLKEFPTPTPAQNELLVRVVAASVNPIDWKVRDRGTRPMPFVLGQDFAGVVSATGAAAHKYNEGERVFGIAREHGAFAEYTLVPEEDRDQPVARIPDDVSDAVAAALPTAGLTALAALEALHVGAGSTLLIVGVTGGVGSIAAQMARDRGAHVVGTARAQNENLARTLGVEDFVAYDRGDSLAAIKSTYPGGIDAVLDLVDDGDRIKRIADVIRDGGALVSTIGAADVPWFSERRVVAQNLIMNQTPQSSHEGLRTLAQMVEQGRLRVPIAAERHFSEVEAALAASKTGTVDGKIVLTLP